MEAGVRQGCPLAPLLYLFVAQALMCWLRSQHVGIKLCPSEEYRVTACQYADDTEVALEGEAEVPHFLQAMDTFAEASGQRLNLDKVELLRIGLTDAALGQTPRAQQSSQQQPPQAPQGETICGLKVVTTASALNLPIDNQLSPPQPDWQKRLEVAYQRMQRLSRFPLSTFGRATAATAYGLQTVTWHMEHGGPPPRSILEEIERLTARLVDRKQGPQDPGQRLTGIPRDLLTGHPRTGGFGLLSLQPHIKARQAVWATRYIIGALRHEGRGIGLSLIHI